MSDDLIALAKAMDLSWMESRFADLAGYIAQDVVMVAPGGKQRIEGLEGAVESYQDFMDRCEVSRFHTFDHVLTQRGAAAVIEYDWDMAWSDRDGDHGAKGREVLVLARRDHGWRVVWRMQLPA